MPRVEYIGLPTFTTHGTDLPDYEMYLVDDQHPWTDNTDSYTKGWAAHGNDPDPNGFHHIISDFGPTVVSGPVTVRLRAAAGASEGALPMRFVANLYAAGADVGSGAVLNLTTGEHPVYVEMPANDNEWHMLDVEIYDWVTEVPATDEQIVEYFAGGGFVLIQPAAFVGSVSNPIGYVGIDDLEFVWGNTRQRIHPRNDQGRIFPKPTSLQQSNRLTGYR
ncbi:MAG TPA: hypothetical protein VJ782_08750 [Aeromicrobium sp.]|nr:hypothetical protein [Aeromicrobium sp.]